MSVRCARGENWRSSFARLATASSSLSSGTHSAAMPQASACLPGMRSERSETFFARLTPIIFSSRAEPPEPGIMPIRISGKASSAVSLTMRKSQASESSKPTPKQ